VLLRRQNDVLRIDDELGTSVALMFGFGRSAVDDGIHGTAGFGGNAFDTITVEDLLDGVCTAFAECHVVFFGTALVAMADDLDGIDIGAGIEAVGVFFDRGFGVTADRRFVEVKVGEGHLADGSIDAFFITADFSARAIGVGQTLGFVDAAVVFADLIGCAIFFNRFRIALGAAAPVAAFLAGGAVQADIRVAVTVDALARAAVADVAFVFFAGAVFVVTALGTLRIETVFVIGFVVVFGRAVRVFVTLGVGRGAAVGETNHEACKNERN